MNYLVLDFEFDMRNELGICTCEATQRCALEYLDSTNNGDLTIKGIVSKILRFLNNKRYEATGVTLGFGGDADYEAFCGLYSLQNKSECAYGRYEIPLIAPYIGYHPINKRTVTLAVSEAVRRAQKSEAAFIN